MHAKKGLPILGVYGRKCGSASAHQRLSGLRHDPHARMEPGMEANPREFLPFFGARCAGDSLRFLDSVCARSCADFSRRPRAWERL